VSWITNPTDRKQDMQCAEWHRGNGSGETRSGHCSRSKATRFGIAAAVPSVWGPLKRPYNLNIAPRIIADPRRPKPAKVFRRQCRPIGGKEDSAQGQGTPGAGLGILGLLGCSF